MSNCLFQGRLMKGSHHWKETCFLCNQWVLQNEEFYLMVIPNDIRTKYGFVNFIVHKEEWDSFTSDLTDEELIHELLNYKKPNKKPLSKEQLENIEFFKKACNDYGFDKCVISRDKRFVKIGKRKTSFTLIYDVIFDKIHYETRSNEGLFGSLFSNELVAKVCNKFYQYKGLSKHEDYTALGLIEKAISDVDKLMGK